MAACCRFLPFSLLISVTNTQIANSNNLTGQIRLLHSPVCCCKFSFPPSTHTHTHTHIHIHTHTHTHTHTQTHTPLFRQKFTYNYNCHKREVHFKRVLAYNLKANFLNTKWCSHCSVCATSVEKLKQTTAHLYTQCSVQNLCAIIKNIASCKRFFTKNINAVHLWIGYSPLSLPRKII